MERMTQSTPAPAGSDSPGQQGGAITGPTLRLRNVSKAFEGVFALRSVDFKAHAGRVKGLVGVNGSGKSTLIKILAGFHEPEPGAEAWFRGESFNLGSAAAAEGLGMRFIHQDLGLVPALSTVDNLALGRGYETRGFVRLGEEARAARAAIKEFGFDFDVRVPIARLRPIERSVVAITRALHREPGEELGVLVLDEPTESLGRAEVGRLFEAIREVAARGAAVLYISHRLEEVLEITDDITVLRDGQVVAEATSDDLVHDSLVGLIVGRELEHLETADQTRSGEVSVRLEGISGGVVENVSTEFHRGEIVGVAGIVGSGRVELPYLIAGGKPLSAGSVWLEGQKLDLSSPRKALRSGVVFVASDRKTESALPDLSVRENVTLSRLEPQGPLRWLGTRRERREVGRWLHQLDVRPPETDRKFATLSGGNQQKAVLARALRCEPRLLVIDEPVQGVDVGAKLAIHKLLLEAAESGITILLASNDADDLATVCGRVLVMGKGGIAAELTGAACTPDHLTAEILRSSLPVTERREA
jgi:ribose transport system ATP-binding protein